MIKPMHGIKQREVWVDWMRVMACFMVMIVHSTEPFYIGGDGAQVLTRADIFWSALFDSLVRMCVPLFIVASSYLQFPLHYSAGEFFKRRAARVLIPFVIWTMVYALYWGEPVDNLKSLLLNFNYAAGHLWFVYMLIGVYLLMPMLSSWAREVGKRELQGYLAIWLLTTLIPLVRDWVSTGELVFTYGPTGIPRQALFPLWGETSWNTYGTFYYISGFIGYMLLGLYFRRFVSVVSWRKTIAVALPLYAVGFAVTAGGFIRRVMITDQGAFPVNGGIDTVAWWETTWGYDTVGVAMMTIACIMVMRKFTASGAVYRRMVLPVSKASYGMYLAHMIVLAAVSGILRETLCTGVNGVLGAWTTPVQILGTAVITFLIVALAAVVLQRIPRAGKYLIG